MEHFTTSKLSERAGLGWLAGWLAGLAG